MNSSARPEQKAWLKRLKKNKAALFGIIMIGLSVFVALFGYFIAPDSTPYANRIILEIGGNKPGFSQPFLLVKKTQVKTSNVFERIVFGKSDAYEYIPISSWQ